MTQPLVVLVYERLLPGGQLVHRLQDLGYRVQVIADASQLAESCAREKPLLVILDLELPRAVPAQAIAELKQSSDTAHIPVIAFGSVTTDPAMEDARKAGATLVVHDSAIVVHLNQFLDQALQVD